MLAPICPFETEVSRFEECDGRSAEETVLKNARGKALEVLGRFPECRVLGADTAVALNGVILGKPKDAADAERMLRFLSGRTHSVFTGVCVADKFRRNGAGRRDESSVQGIKRRNDKELRFKRCAAR